MTYSSSVIRDTDVICVKDLSRDRVVSDFLYTMNQAIKEGIDDFQIDFSETDATFPNACTPMAGILEYYKKHGIKFEYTGASGKIGTTRMLQPIVLSKKELLLSKNSLNKVWKFCDSDDVKQLVDAYIDELYKSGRFAKGTLPSLEWSLNEVMDNVIQHADIECGYIMGQIHGNGKYVAFTIYDYGRGIYNSLKNSVHAPRNVIDALTLSIQEEVTRDKRVGQGNGLFGLHSIIKQGNGSLVITSGNGLYSFKRGEIYTYSRKPMLSKTNASTTIDIQLDSSKELSLEKALVFRGKVHKLLDLKLENLENEQGYLHYKVKDYAEGTGTRQAAARVKNEIINMITEARKKIILDFTGVAVISSSFADELIAKLLMELGFFQFNNVISLKGMDGSQQTILQRSVIQRLIEEYQN